MNDKLFDLLGIIRQSKENFERQFGKSHIADWVYDDIIDLAKTEDGDPADEQVRGVEPHACACKFKDDVCVEACCYHADLEAETKRLSKINEELRVLLAHKHNENIGFKS